MGYIGRAPGTVSSAADLEFDNTGTGLVATNTGAAITELALDVLEGITTAAVGQGTITVLDSANAVIRIGGALLVEGVDYTITDATTVTLTTALVGGEEVEVVDTTPTVTLIEGIKGEANGLASLDAAGLVPSTQLPSYVDDVVEVATHADLPVTGEVSKMYVVVADETSGSDTSTYRWTGVTYALISNMMTGADIKALYDGEYIARVGSNYIDAATKLDEVVDLLDVQAKVGTDALATEALARAAADARLVYVVPAIDTDPVNGAGTIAVDSGSAWICSDATAGANVWVALDDQTGAEIKALYEVELKAYTDTKDDYLDSATALTTTATTISTAINELVTNAGAMQVEVDKVESTIGASIDANGDYVLDDSTGAPVTNYLQDNSSITEDIRDLDAQAKLEETARLAVGAKILYGTPGATTNPANGVNSLAVDGAKVYICVDATVDANVWVDTTNVDNNIDGTVNGVYTLAERAQLVTTTEGVW